MIEIIQIPVLQDNYSYLLHNDKTGETAVVDPSEAPPILDMLNKKQWKLSHILSTHHHHDHVGGNIDIKQITGCKVVGLWKDSERIPGVDVTVKEDQEIVICGSKCKIIFIPGHTRGHIAYYFPSEHKVFCGDTLFSVGCGRLFEGTPEQMVESLAKLAKLPDNTEIYCGHEYTVSNCQFALTVEPGNKDLQARQAQAKQLRSKGQSTVPSTVAMEKATNPFLRIASPEIRKNLGMAQENEVDVFAKLRLMKDRF